MNPDTMQRFEDELRQAFDGSVVANDANRKLIRLATVDFPDGCIPQRSAALVVLDPAADKPEFYLAQVPRLASGNQPATGQVMVGGEIWNTYSYAIQNWDQIRSTAVQFVQAKLRRFALAQ
ncbi:MAG: hypothetical protein LAO76_22485 [Acidobacteriia bacterium]|nr:hypothetical protein [Terriglobia bacterium]